SNMFALDLLQQQAMLVLNGQALVASINHSLAIMDTSFQMLAQRTGIRGRRHLKTYESLLDYLCHTMPQFPKRFLEQDWRRLYSKNDLNLEIKPQCQLWLITEQKKHYFSSSLARGRCVSQMVFRTRFEAFVFQEWPKSGNQSTMPIVVNYRT
ncbi:hypothetical protein M8C21_004375, partial [Ambrosia artemisiifolia]